MTESSASIAPAENCETSSLSLWTSLEASLRSSQYALLGHDLERLETAVAEQLRLLRAMRATDPKRRRDQDVQLAHQTSPVSAALQSAQLRVQSLARVQQGLLERAQRSLQVLSHLVAGPQAVYGPLVQGAGIVVHPAARAEVREFSAEEA